jgi:hypothetical protein
MFASNAQSPARVADNTLYIEALVNRCSFLGGSNKKARCPNHSVRPPGSTADHRSMPSGLACGRLKSCIALEAMDCLLKLPGPLHHNYPAGYGLATAGTQPESTGNRSLVMANDEYKLCFQWLSASRLRDFYHLPYARKSRASPRHQAYFH